MKPTRVAASKHTAVLLLILFLVSAWGALFIRREEVNSRIPIYLQTLLGSWLLAAFTLWGVRREGVPLREVLGPRWQGFGSVMRDVGIAMASWVVVLIIVGLAARTMGIDGRSAAQFLLPRGGLEIGIWILVSVTAGFCEELVFRGYLQRQFAALTGSEAGGLVLSSVAFAIGHTYQGLGPALIIGLFGILLGCLAYWRKSVRPGMILHAWQDIVSGLLGSLTRS